MNTTYRARAIRPGMETWGTTSPQPKSLPRRLPSPGRRAGEPLLQPAAARSNRDTLETQAIGHTGRAAGTGLKPHAVKPHAKPQPSNGSAEVAVSPMHHIAKTVCVVSFGLSVALQLAAACLPPLAPLFLVGSSLSFAVFGLCDVARRLYKLDPPAAGPSPTPTLSPAHGRNAADTSLWLPHPDTAKTRPTPPRRVAHIGKILSAAALFGGAVLFLCGVWALVPLTLFVLGTSAGLAAEICKSGYDSDVRRWLKRLPTDPTPKELMRQSQWHVALRVTKVAAAAMFVAAATLSIIQWSMFITFPILGLGTAVIYAGAVIGLVVAMFLKAQAKKTVARQAQQTH